MPPPEIPLRLKGKRSEYADVYTYIFEPLEPVVFEPGQYIHMRVPGLVGKEGVREFSFASAPSEKDIWFSMHVRPESAFKMRLAELVPGDLVTIFKIKGDFIYPTDEKQEIVFVAGGVGVTPFRSMVNEREKRGLALPDALIHVASDGYLYQDEFRMKAIEQQYITRAQVDKILADIVERKPSALYYVAGSPYFTVTLESVLEALGVSKEQIRRDDFDGYEGDA